MPTSCRSTPTSAAGAYPGINPFRREKPAKPQAPPPLRAEALALPVPVIVEEQLDEWRVAFDELDLDGDGRLSGRELQVRAAPASQAADLPHPCAGSDG